VSPRPIWWVALALSVLAVGAISIGVERRDSAVNQRKFCVVVATMDDSYRETPPTTAAGRNLAESIAQLRHDLGCSS
jgi:hypothetical protein